MTNPITTTSTATPKSFELDRRITPDPKWPGMYRVKMPGGRLTDMMNLTRAKGELAELVASRRRSS